MKWYSNQKILDKIAPSVAELRIIKLLNEIKIEYFREVCFEGLISSKGFPLRFDFYIPRQNLLIEYDGYHHDSKIVTEIDLIKNDFALKNRIVLKRFNKSSWKDLEIRIWQLVHNGRKRSIVKVEKKKKKIKYKRNGMSYKDAKARMR